MRSECRAKSMCWSPPPWWTYLAWNFGCFQTLFSSLIVCYRGSEYPNHAVTPTERVIRGPLKLKLKLKCESNLKLHMLCEIHKNLTSMWSAVIVDLEKLQLQVQIKSALQRNKIIIVTKWLHYRRVCKGHFTRETESLWPLLHYKHSHWWRRQSRSKSASHYAWGTNRVCECKMDVKSVGISTWHQMDHVSWSLGVFSKPISWR